MAMLILRVWAIFKYINPKYLVASIVGIFVVIAANLLITSDANFDADNHFLQIVVSIAFMFLISLIDYLLDRLKNKQDMD